MGGLFNSGQSGTSSVSNNYNKNLSKQKISNKQPIYLNGNIIDKSNMPADDVDMLHTVMQTKSSDIESNNLGRSNLIYYIIAIVIIYFILK